jgi:predicted nuclease of predicted toxin-antitoxin system
MAIRFLVDENLHGRLWSAVVHHNARGVDPIDAVQVGDPPDLPRGSEDPDILIWAEREDRILVSRDLSTLPHFLSDHLQAGHHSPGVFLIRRGTTLHEVVDFLVLAAYASEPWEWTDRCQFIPV